MAETIIVGHDGHPRSEDAIALAGLLAPLLDGRLLVVTVVQPGGEAGELADGTLERRVIEARSPARALDGAARDEGAQLVVLGSTHRGTLGRIHPGSVAERLLAGGPCAVAVAPVGYADRASDRVRVVEVGFKNTPESRAALEWAQQVGLAAGATLRIFAVFQPGADEPGPLALQFRDELEDALRDAAAGVPDELRPLARLLDGDAAAALVAEAGKGVDLLVLGSRGYGPLAAALVGGVAARIVRHAPVPTVVVPRAGA